MDSVALPGKEKIHRIERVKLYGHLKPYPPVAFDNGGRNVIPDSIKLTAGRTGQEYNIRKNRKGAFWEDRYHATAVEKNRYLRQCITYIDMNMVRAGVVESPHIWSFVGIMKSRILKREREL